MLWIRHLQIMIANSEVCVTNEMQVVWLQVCWLYHVWIRHIYTIILLKSVCRRSQTAGRNSCSIVSGDVSNCSYRLKIHPVTSSHLSSAYNFFIGEKHRKSLVNQVTSACVYLNDPATGYECQRSGPSLLGANE